MVTTACYTEMKVIQMDLHTVAKLYWKVDVELQQIQRQLHNAVVLCLEIVAGDVEIQHFQMHLRYEVA